jgi:hypothetical protein
MDVGPSQALPHQSMPIDEAHGLPVRHHASICQFDAYASNAVKGKNGAQMARRSIAPTNPLRFTSTRFAPSPTRRRLTSSGGLACHGVGPWTAGVYLLMALRRPDIWPPGDLALQQALSRVRGLEGRSRTGRQLSASHSGRRTHSRAGDRRHSERWGEGTGHDRIRGGSAWPRRLAPPA